MSAPVLEGLRERLQARFVPDEETGCWVWQGGTGSKGYGRFRWWPGKRTSAHQAVYEVWIGPIPDGLILDHLCRNPSCVNPAHLEPVTFAENVLRGNGACARNARKTHCPRGHEYDAHDGERRYCSTCRREYWRVHRGAEWQRQLRAKRRAEREATT